MITRDQADKIAVTLGLEKCYGDKGNPFVFYKLNGETFAQSNWALTAWLNRQGIKKAKNIIEKYNREKL